MDACLPDSSGCVAAPGPLSASSSSSSSTVSSGSDSGTHRVCSPLLLVVRLVGLCFSFLSGLLFVLVLVLLCCPGALHSCSRFFLKVRNVNSPLNVVECRSLTLQSSFRAGHERFSTADDQHGYLHFRRTCLRDRLRSKRSGS